MKKTSIFHQKLIKAVFKKMVLSIFIGCMLFCTAFFGISYISQIYNQNKHFDEMASSYSKIIKQQEEFLNDKENIVLMKKKIRTREKLKEIQYVTGRFNSEAMIKTNIVLSDSYGNAIFSTFQEDAFNLHREIFNKTACLNAEKNGKGLYKTVYFFSGSTSEYVLIRPLYDNDKCIGFVSSYMDDDGWSQYFSKYQYDVIITNEDHNIVYCSNRQILQNCTINKYEPKSNTHMIRVNKMKYLTRKCDYKNLGIILYSFVYHVPNTLYVALGTLTIIILGVIWTLIFRRMLDMMADKTSDSVDMLVNEIRIIRKKDMNHVIIANTGDEIEEIAEQINKMVKSINELNEKNLELVKINSDMEMRNLQARLNPHFIYNTLDNIRYLTESDPVLAEDLIGRVTHILRFTINNEEEKVLLCDDLDFIRDYFVIQKTRFGNRFNYNIGITDECMQVRIPKLLLQPIIENSIKYGFKSKNEIEVTVTGKVVDDYMVLTVLDNGSGVSVAELAVLRESIIKEKNDSSHNGLQNTNRRIQLEYGQESEMSLDSVEGINFSVTLRIFIGNRLSVEEM